MEKQFALEQLRKFVKPGDTVATTIGYHTSATTYVRVLISGGLFPTYAGPSDISPMVTAVTGRKVRRTAKGVPEEFGSDAEVEVFMQLCRAMFRDGWVCIGDGNNGRPVCPSAEHNGPGSMPYSEGMPHHDIVGLHHNRLG
jgi:hypothetical protein